MDVDLPVWTIRPNWAQGILERLEWLTDVLTSDTGVEQRRSVRMSPRRSFEITVNPTRAIRTYLDLVTHRLGSETWLLPLWHDQAITTAAAAAAQRHIAFDNTFREHEIDGYSILYYDTFSWEVVKVAAQDAAGITTTADLVKTWPKGTKVFPLRLAILQDPNTAIKALTGTVGESTLLWLLNQANDYPEMAGGAMLNYQGSPLLTLAPDRSTEITTEQTRIQDSQDSQTGLIFRTDSANRAFAVQSHGWQIKGREAHADFRSFLYTLRGRQRMVWLPTFNDDLIITDPVAIGATRANIEACGMSYVGGGGPIPGRATAWTGSEVVNIASIQAPPGPGRERLGLLTPTAGSYAPGASWAFLQAARLDQDQVELHHHTDSDGTMECAAGFKTFFNVRDPSGSTFLPIPDAEMTPGQCGSPAGLNPCSYVPFNGIFMTVTFTSSDPCNPCHTGNRVISIPNQQPHPGGQVVGGYEDDGGGCAPYTGGGVHETFVDGSATLRGQPLLVFTQTNFVAWHVDFYFPVVGQPHVHVFPASRFCGSVGKDSGKGEVSYTKFDYTGAVVETVSYGSQDMAGISDSDWGP